MLVSRIISLAMKAAGILGQGQTASSAITQDAFDALNAMVGQWAVKRWLIYHLVDATKACTGAQSYTVGPGGDFVFAARPSDIESAYVTQTNSGQRIDTPLDILKAREDYNRIAMKSLATFPYTVYYDNAYPQGLLYPWPVPNFLYSLTITAKMPLSAFTSLSQDINLPAEYQEALVWNLAARLRVLNQLELDPGVLGLAKAALATVRAANTQIPMLSLPGQVQRHSRFNVYSGQ